MSKTKTLVVIDGKSVFYRGFYAMPGLALPDGTPTGGVYGFAMMAFEVLKKFDPDYIVVAWDKSKTNIRSRRKLYPEYKANRKPMPDEMRMQIPLLRDLMDAFNWPLYECDDYEADDILGTLAIKAKDHDNIDTILVTSDLDALQLVNGHTHVAALKRGLTNLEYFDEKHFTEKYEMTPQQFIDYKALRGDSSDNIPGVKGVGEKTATQLIKDYGSLEEVYEHIDEIKGATRKKLEADKDMAYLSRNLVTILLDAPIDFEEERSDVRNVDIEAVREKLHAFRFRSLLNQIDSVFAEQAPTDSKQQTQIKRAQKVDVEKINWKKPVVVTTFGGNFVCSDDIGRFAECEPSDIPGDAQLIGHDLKPLLQDIFDGDIPLTCIAHDTRIAAFVLNSLNRQESLDQLAADELGINQEFDGPDITVQVIWKLYDIQQAELDAAPKLKKIAQDFDFPSIPLLARVENRGIKLDKKELAKLAEEFENTILDTEQEIFGLADEEFNVASTQQLSRILFEKLELPVVGIKKTKTGYSTAASELDKLRGKHPIIDLISRYREYTKLKSTYVDTLPQQVAEDGRVHTIFSLTTAQTGRLSSSDPNLQNIPVRTELGRRVRHAFVPEKGNVFVNLDYSQFELRLAAALSGDEGMIETFNSDQDIHAKTAAEVEGVALDEVTKEQRYAAKAVNFGIMYGMSAHGLTQATGMTRQEAQDFIDKYFNIRSKLKEYLDKLVEQAKTQGYVETIFGRRRPMPDIKSPNFMVREGAKRMAMNMPIQGTEADIMKLAMLKLEEELPKGAKQILQVHDSIMIECPKEMADEVAELGRESMENIYDLPVRLKVDQHITTRWE